MAYGLAAALSRIGLNLGANPASSSVTIQSRVVDRLEAEVIRLRHERRQFAAQNELLNEIIGRDGPSSASRFLRHLVPSPTDGVAALVDLSTPAQTLLAFRGSALDADTRILIPDDLQVELQTQREPLAVRDYQLRTIDGGSPLLAIQDIVPESDLGMSSSKHMTAGKLYVVPIREEDRLAGILISTSLGPAGPHARQQVEVVGRLGQMILLRCQQERQLASHQSELRLTQDMLRLKAVTDRATDQPLETLGEFTSGLCDAAGFDRAALFLASRRDGDATEPTVEAGQPLPPTVAVEWRRHETRLALSSVQSVRCDVVDGGRLESLAINTLIGQATVLPLHSSGRRLGVLVLSRRARDPLPDTSLKLVEWSAELLAQTLCRIYRDAAIRRQARHDGLTDLANRRTFDTLLAGEIDRVRIGLSEECSLLLADLDHFKLVNDQYGHQAGDEVLRVTAQLLREHVGRMRVGERSLLARYGGEELAVLLPGVGTAGALRVAEEIRMAIETLAIKFGDTRLGVTVSIGVACCPLHGMCAAELVKSADSALYRAKSEGRNRVCRPPDHGRC
jgi:diguanylate cyclase (GGDEF)-like protein